MSNYTKTTNFTAKDSLPSGNPSKIILGSEHDTEFNAISTAIASKADSVSSTLTSPTLTSPTLTNPTATAAINFNVPANAWTVTGFAPAPLGASWGGMAYSGGSFRFSLVVNGYRDNTAGTNLWYSTATNGATGAASLELDPTGFITFQAQSVKATGSASSITEVARITEDGLGVGTVPISGYELSVSSGTSLNTAYFKSTDAGASGMNINYFKDSATPVASDDIANLRFFGNDSGSTITEYVRFVATIEDTTNTSEDGQFGLYTQKAGAFGERVRYSALDGFYIIDGAFRAPDVYASTVAGSANMIMTSSSGILQRATSSRRYKNSIENAPYGLAEVMQLRPVTFKGNNDGDKIFGGFVAEEIDAVGLTQFVQYDDQNRPDSVGYDRMVSLLTKAIQEQQAMIEDLKSRVTALGG
jgi:hypothetical protein